MAEAKQVPAQLKYTNDHEWVSIENGLATIGITDYAQSCLGDITFVELPKIGATLLAGQTAGAVESVKAASDIYSPLSGSVTEINEEINSKPEMLNSSPYQTGWLFKMRVSKLSELDGLLNSASYTTLVEGI